MCLAANAKAMKITTEAPTTEPKTIGLLMLRYPDKGSLKQKWRLF